MTPCHLHLRSATLLLVSSLKHQPPSCRPLLFFQPAHPRPSKLVSSHCRPFTTTLPRSDNTEKTHYEILQVPPDCTGPDLKKQFYTLSRATHPDTNPNDPHASSRFSQIAHSYSVLSNPEKRRRYDRDTMRHQHTSSSSRSGNGHKGSFAGSRPASGLSKRRGAFRGPPPSYYAQQNSSSSTSSESTSSPNSNPSDQQPPWSSPFVDPSFHTNSTFKTQTHEDNRRQSRRAAAMERAQKEAEDDGSFWARFLVVSGIIVGAVSVGTIFAGMGIHKGGMTRADGSRRGGDINAWTKG